MLSYGLAKGADNRLVPMTALPFAVVNLGIHA